MNTTVACLIAIGICLACSIAIEVYEDWYLKNRKNDNKKSD